MRTLTNTNRWHFGPVQIGTGFAWLAVLIYAAGNSIATLLVDLGAADPLTGGRNAITFTNLFFLGSIISLVPMVALFRGDWTRDNLRRLRLRDWGMLSLSALLSSALTPGLFFYALEHSSVTNVVLISRIEPPLFLLAAFFILRERLDPRAMLAGLIALGGAIVILDQNCGDAAFAPGAGELAAAAATLSFIASAIVARRALQHIPMGIFSIYRTVVGTAIYFALISLLQGPEQFKDILAPVLLKWIWVYAIIVIVVGQLAWFMALKYARSQDISLATSFSPLAGIVFAMLILGEDPGPGLLPGGALILLAVGVGNLKGAPLQQTRRQINRMVRVRVAAVGTQRL